MDSKRIILLALALAVCALSTGCGYSSKRPFDTSIETVHVEMLHSKEFRRGLEFYLTEALVKRINMDTPYRIADKTSADTLFTGEILEVRQNVLGKQMDSAEPREMGTTVIMQYVWKDQRNGKILVERPRFLHMDSYIPLVGESFAKGVEVRALDRMAERIVETMETDW